MDFTKYVCPKSIYKYLDYSGIEKTLENQTFKLSRPTDLNDPLDLFIQESLGADQVEFLQDLQEEFHNFVSGDIDYSKLRNDLSRDKIILINQALKNATPQQKEEIKREILQWRIEDMYDLSRLEETNAEALSQVQNSFKNEGIFCSTTDNNNLLMWAHYSDKHRGAVIEFTPNTEKDSAFLASKPVEYSEIRPLLYRNAKDMIQHGFTMSLEESVFKIIHNLIYTKSLDWSYEKEYRLSIPELISPMAEYGTLKFHSDEITSIYFGCRMPQANKKKLISLAKAINPNVLFYDALLSRREYELYFEKIDN